MLQSFSRFILNSFGWTVEKKILTGGKYVLIGAPHTSNWDFPLTMLAMASMGIRFSWVAKHSIFVFPIAGLFKKMGGIPLDRSYSGGFIDYIISLYEQHDELAIAIAPEGTRAYTDHWKSGFYYIAKGAGVPLAFGYIDYKNKRLGISGGFVPGDDLEADMKKIAEFYADKTGKYPDQQGPIILKPKD